MAPITFERVIRSKLFRFTVGPDKHEFMLHSAVVAAQSRPLHNLVFNENFAEGQKNHAVLESVDEHTFVLFCEYIYTGKYGLRVQVPAPPEVEPLDVPPEEVDSWGSSSTKKKKAYTSGWVELLDEEAVPPPPDPVSKQHTAWLDFVGPTRWYFPQGDDFQPMECESAGDVLLLHAKMFVLADYYDVTGLVSLTINRLHRALVDFDLHDGTLGEIDRLLRYVSEEPRPQQLLDLINAYASCKIKELWGSRDIRNVLMTHEELFGPVIGMVLERLD